MMNIGILTFHNSDNYGSVLQASALKKFVESINEEYSCRIINYVPEKQEELYAIYLPNTNIKNILKNIRSFCFRKILKQRKEGFKIFREKELKLEGCKMNQSMLNEEYMQSFDAIIVGSDQIWNPRSLDFSMTYFLPSYKGKKIAYAPSFGNGTKEDFYKNNLQKPVEKALRSFNSISVRELSGVSIVKSLSDKEAKVVIDPTLLIKREWNTIASKCGEGEKYIFFYAIDYNYEAIRMVDRISKITHLPVKVIFSTNKTYRALSKGFHLVKESSPYDFLGLIKNATLVLSSSFHGTAFSLIYEKKFWALEVHRDGVIYEDQRIHNLLSQVQLENRIIKNDDIESVDLFEEISFDERLLDNIVNESKAYLINSLKG